MIRVKVGTPDDPKKKVRPSSGQRQGSSAVGIKSINTVLVIDDRDVQQGALDFALALAERNKAHLDFVLVVNQLDLPTSRILPLVHAVQDEVNGERMRKAQLLAERLDAAARLAGVSCEHHISKDPLPEARDSIIQKGLLSDVILFPKPAEYLSIELALIEGALFASGRPVIVIPNGWTNVVAPKKIAVAWNGSGRAARALGDAMPFIEDADTVEIVCATDDASDETGAEAAIYLARHAPKVSLTRLPVGFQSDGEVIRNHLALTKPDLLVMGAFGHSRVFEFVLGGVTRTMLYEAPVPVLYSF